MDVGDYEVIEPNEMELVWHRIDECELSQVRQTNAAIAGSRFQLRMAMSCALPPSS